MTETLLSGNYVEALLSFDNVLARGFSGQTFMAGLNRHLRDLLVARNEPSLRLLEFTGTLMERYRTQAAACPPEFLFGAISLLTDLDGKIRQSSNQRLLVELGLMKIAGLGQKKIPVDPVNLPIAGTGSDRPRAIRTGPSAIDTTDGSRARSSPATVQRPTAAAAESSPGIAASAPAATPAAKPQPIPHLRRHRPLPVHPQCRRRPFSRPRNERRPQQRRFRHNRKRRVPVPYSPDSHREFPFRR